jgi:DNA-binding MarR family transcriptional regulator
MPGPDLLADERLTLMGLLVESHATLTRVLGAELEKECGLPLTWYDVMIRLGRSVGGFLTMTQLAAEVSLTSGGITRLVDRIEAGGYVERQGCPNDRRSVHVALTEQGRRKVEEATSVHLDGIERHLCGLLEPTERDALAGILRKVRGNWPVCGAVAPSSVGGGTGN